MEERLLVSQKNGVVTMSSSFYAYLAEHFVTKEFVTTLQQSAGGVKESGRVQQVPLPQKTWSQFLAENEQRLRVLIESEIADHATKGHIIDREDVSAMLQKEWKQVQEYVAKQVSASPPASPSPSSTSGSAAKVRDVTVEEVKAMIRGALHKYDADTLALPDYALYSAGARPVRGLTSKGFEGSRCASWWWPSFLGGLCSPRPPSVALSPDNHRGNCWPFKGASGTLTVDLQATILPKQITIDHVPRASAVDMRSAPRHVEVWGFTAAEIARAAGGTKLGNFEYDIHANEPVQTFTVLVLSFFLHL